ncbi:hypothetical protein WGC_01137 [Escherichia coli KTE41]|nr:hypothetical protein WGC_01137 [Escherichia coli KTE41]
MISGVLIFLKFGPALGQLWVVAAGVELRFELFMHACGWFVIGVYAAALFSGLRSVVLVFLMLVPVLLVGLRVGMLMVAMDGIFLVSVLTGGVLWFFCPGHCCLIHSFAEAFRSVFVFVFLAFFFRRVLVPLLAVVCFSRFVGEQVFAALVADFWLFLVRHLRSAVSWLRFALQPVRLLFW